MADVQQIGTRNPDGATFGASTTDKTSAYGVTPIVQRSGANGAAAGTTAATSTTPWGFATSTQANAAILLLDELRTTVVNWGLHKGAA